MTGGTVVILGTVGRNFGAGMSGGVAYILDEKKGLEHLCNLELIALSPVTPAGEKVLKEMIQSHFKFTGSPLANRILKKWTRYVKLFRWVHPKDLKVVQQLTAAAGWTDEPLEEVTLPARA